MPPLHGRHHDPGNQQRTRHPGPSMLEHTRPGTHANTDHAERGARTTLIGTKRRGAADRQHVPTVPTPDETGAALPGAGIHEGSSSVVCRLERRVGRLELVGEAGRGWDAGPARSVRRSGSARSCRTFQYRAGRAARGPQLGCIRLPRRSWPACWMALLLVVVGFLVLAGGGVRGLPPPPAGEAHQRCRRRGYRSGHGRCRRSSGRGPRRPATGRPALGGLPIPGCRPLDRRGCAGWSRGVVLELCGHKHGEDVPRPGERLRCDAGFQPCQAELERRSHAGALVSDNCPLPKNILHNMSIPGGHARARLLLRG